MECDGRMILPLTFLQKAFQLTKRNQNQAIKTHKLCIYTIYIMQGMHVCCQIYRNPWAFPTINLGFCGVLREEYVSFCKYEKQGVDHVNPKSL